MSNEPKFQRLGHKHFRSGFPTGIENLGELYPPPPLLQNLIGGGLESMHGGTIGGELKMLSKNTFEGVHLLVKLPTISLQIY